MRILNHVWLPRNFDNGYQTPLLTFGLGRVWAQTFADALIAFVNPCMKD